MKHCIVETGRPSWRPVFVLAAAFGLCGCGIHVKRTGTLPCYARLSDHPHIARAYCPEGRLLSDYKTLYLKGVQPAGRVAPSDEHVEHYQQFLMRRIRAGLRRLRKFDVITTDPDCLNPDRGDARIAQLQVFITYLDEGRGLARYVLGFEAGSVDVQIEGSLTDARTGDVLIEFADRQRYAGNPYQGLNPTVVMAVPLVEKVLVRQAYAIVKLFRSRP